jgi:uncharacterized GH25 family protein
MRPCRPLRLPRFIAAGRAAAFAAALLLPRAATAHDYWMVPQQLVFPGEQEVAVSLFVGEDFAAEEERAFEGGRTSRFLHLHGGQSIDLVPAARDGSIPMLRLRVAGDGGHLLVLDRNIAKIELPPEKFETYLRHEAIDDVVAERARRGESAKPGRERYTRSLKALVQVGEERDETFAKAIGQTLELIPETNPVFAAPGERLGVKILFRGIPLANARIEAFSRAGAEVSGAEIRSDERGIALVPIDRRGVWLLRMVHMVRCDGCPDADWESTWASYVFASRPSDGGTVTAPAMMAAVQNKPDAPARAGHIRFLVGAVAVALVALFFLARRRAGKSV